MRWHAKFGGFSFCVDLAEFGDIGKTKNTRLCLMNVAARRAAGAFDVGRRELSRPRLGRLDGREPAAGETALQGGGLVVVEMGLRVAAGGAAKVESLRRWRGCWRRFRWRQRKHGRNHRRVR